MHLVAAGKVEWRIELALLRLVLAMWRLCRTAEVSARLRAFRERDTHLQAGATLVEEEGGGFNHSREEDVDGKDGSSHSGLNLSATPRSASSVSVGSEVSSSRDVGCAGKSTSTSALTPRHHEAHELRMHIAQVRFES